MMNENKLIVAVDVDGVLRRFTDRLVEVYLEDFPDHDVKPITTWWFETSFPIGKEIYKYYKANAHRIFPHAKPYEGAKEFVESLRNLGYKVVIATTQPSGSEIFTFDWVRKNIGEVDGIFFGDQKWFVDFDILIDDAPHNIEQAQKHGKFAIFFTQEWNKEHEGQRVSSYKELLELLTDIERITFL